MPRAARWLPPSVLFALAITALPARDAAREQEVADFIAEADRLVRDRNYSGHAVDHYKVQTDDPRVSARAAGELLESFRAFFGSYWPEAIALEPYEGHAQIYLLYSYFKYNRLLTGKDRFDEFRSQGHYRPYFDVVVVHTESHPGGLADTLVHEAAHQLLAQQLFRGRPAAAPWLSEGLASYFGFTQQLPDRSFVPGVIGGKAIRLFPEAKTAQAGTGWNRVQALKKEWKKLDPWPASSLVAIEDQADFFAKDVVERYTASWLLVHFLLHADGERYREGFLTYVTHEIAGAGGARVFHDDVGLAADDLDRAFRAYVLSLKPRLKKK